MNKKGILLMTIILIFSNILNTNAFNSKNILEGEGVVDFSYNIEVNTKGSDGETISSETINTADQLNIGLDDFTIDIGVSSGTIDEDGLENTIDEGITYDENLLDRMKEITQFTYAGIDIDLGKFDLIDYQSQFKNLNDDELRQSLIGLRKEIEQKKQDLNLFFKDNSESFENDQQSFIYYSNIQTSNIPKTLNFISTKENSANNVNYFFNKLISYQDKSYLGDIITNINNIFSYSTMNFGSLGDNLININDDLSAAQNDSKNNIINKEVNDNTEDTTIIQDITPEDGVTVGETDEDKIRVAIENHCSELPKFYGFGRAGQSYKRTYYTGYPKPNIDYSNHSNIIGDTDCEIDPNFQGNGAYNPCYKNYTLIKYYEKGDEILHYFTTWGDTEFFTKEVIIPVSGYNIIINSLTSCTKTIETGSWAGESKTWTSPYPLLLE